LRASRLTRRSALERFMKVLLVEDDLMIGAAIGQALRDAAYAVDWVQDGDDASDMLERHAFELVLLDITLPHRDGLGVLQVTRARGDHVPIILITARDAIDDRIRGLDAGADDYLVKPFDVSELLARMRAVSRRRGGSGAPLLSNGFITLDPATKEASVGDAPVQLSKREFALLRELMIRPGAILSRAELEDRIYGAGEEVESNVVDFIIHGLRKKLGSRAITNVRGLGWSVERHA
jgi:two-component system OmpR family response regulator